MSDDSIVILIRHPSTQNTWVAQVSLEDAGDISFDIGHLPIHPEDDSSDLYDYDDDDERETRCLELSREHQAAVAKLYFWSLNEDSILQDSSLQKPATRGLGVAALSCILQKLSVRGNLLANSIVKTCGSNLPDTPSYDTLVALAHRYAPVYEVEAGLETFQEGSLTNTYYFNNEDPPHVNPWSPILSSMIGECIDADIVDAVTFYTLKDFLASVREAESPEGATDAPASASELDLTATIQSLKNNKTLWFVDFVDGKY